MSARWLRCRRSRQAPTPAPNRVHRLTEALAAEWKGKITVNAVLPSIIDTAANRASMPKADFSKWGDAARTGRGDLFLVAMRQCGHRRAAPGKRAV